MNDFFNQINLYLRIDLLRWIILKARKENINLIKINIPWNFNNFYDK